MSVNQMKSRDLTKLLGKAGYIPKRTKGSHQVWSKGGHSVAVPLVNLRSIIAAKIVNECGLCEFLA